MSDTKIDRRGFLASAGVVAAVGAMKDENELVGGEVLRIRKGDIIVLRATGPISQDTAERLRDKVRENFPEGVKVMVMDNGLTISVLRPE